MRLLLLMPRYCAKEEKTVLTSAFRPETIAERLLDSMEGLLKSLYPLLSRNVKREIDEASMFRYYCFFLSLSVNDDLLTMLIFDRPDKV